MLSLTAWSLHCLHLQACIHAPTAIIRCYTSQLLSMPLRFGGSEKPYSMLPLRFVKAKHSYDTTLLHDGITLCLLEQFCIQHLPP